MSANKTFEDTSAIETQIQFASSISSNKVETLLKNSNLRSETINILLQRYAKSNSRTSFNKIIVENFENLVNSPFFTEAHMKSFLVSSFMKPIRSNNKKFIVHLIQSFPQFLKVFPEAFEEANQKMSWRQAFFNSTHCSKDLIPVVPLNVWVETYTRMLNFTKTRKKGDNHLLLADNLLSALKANPESSYETLSYLLEMETKHSKDYSPGYKRYYFLSSAESILRDAVKPEPKEKMITKVVNSTEVKDEESSLNQENFKGIIQRFEATKLLVHNFLEHLGSNFPQDIKVKLNEAQKQTENAIKFHESNLALSSSPQKEKALQISSTKALNAIISFERVVEFILEAAEVETENDVKIKDSFDDIIVKTRTWSEMKKITLQ